MSTEQIEEPILEQSSPGITLKLGDIILIKDSTNEILNDNVFIIEYIDQEKIKLIRTDNLSKIVLTINPDGSIGDGTITEIDILSRDTNEGYARQNGLIPGEWVDIVLATDVRTIITAKITDLQEDMIELDTYPDNQKLYINFEFKGIPEDLPIQSITIINPPKSTIKEQTEGEGEGEGEVEGEEPIVLGEIEEEEQEYVNVPPTAIKEQMKKVIFDADQLEFGDYLDEVHETIYVDKDKYRYNIEVQTNDMLEDILSTIPPQQRTPSVMKNIHQLITRYTQLRELGSDFDENMNIIGITTKRANALYKPLAEYLSQLKNKLYWIVYVSKLNKNFYISNSDETNEEYYNYQNIYEVVDELNDIRNSFRKGSTGEDQNKYIQYLSKLNTYSVPYTLLNPELTKSAAILYEGPVNDNVFSYTNTIDDMYSYSGEMINERTQTGMYYKMQMKSNRFITQQYNETLSRIQVDGFKKSIFNPIRVKVGLNDTIELSSIMMLPEPVVRFSRVNLHDTSIMDRANLSMFFFNYSQLLNKKTQIKDVQLWDLNTEVNYLINEETGSSNFVNDVANFKLSNIDSNIDQETRLKTFLNNIIPRTITIFKLVKKYITGKLSIIDVVSYLEPFMIYTPDLTFTQYIEITRFINEKIIEYKKSYAELDKYFSALKKESSTGSNVNQLFNLLDKQHKLIAQLTDTYKINTIDKNVIVTTSEYLKKIITSDYGNLYNTAVDLYNIRLMYPKELTPIFEFEKDKYKADQEQNVDKCNNYVIAKKYRLLEELEKDNDRDIYFDKVYDTTPYMLLNDPKVIQKQKQSSIEEFTLFLMNVVQREHKLSEDESRYIAESLVNGSKKVIDGQYAIYVNEKLVPSYYVRRDNKWVQDDSKRDELKNVVENQDVLCVLQNNCFYTAGELNGDCVDSKVVKNKLMETVMKDLITQFDKKYEISKDELEEKLNRHLIYYSEKFNKILEIQNAKLMKYNDFQYNLGLTTLEDFEYKPTSDDENKEIHLRDLILGQYDFSKKQNDILQFCSNLTRPPVTDTFNIVEQENESPYWLYSVKTNTRLMPMFLYKLAKAYSISVDAYNAMVEIIVKESGKISPDGDKKIDEHTGYVITNIEFDVEEGYEDGFKIKSRDILEQELGETLVFGTREIEKVMTTKQGRIVAHMIATLEAFMGINLYDKKEFMIKLVIDLIKDNNVLESEEMYKKRVEEIGKRNPTQAQKLPSYNNLVKNTLLYITLGTFLIGIQTSIPSIKTKKVFPGCVKSFKGFPFYGEGDDSSLMYIACVASNIEKTAPWDVLKGLKQDKIVEKLKFFITKYLLPNQDVQNKIKDKIEYLRTNTEIEDVPEEHNIQKWSNYLPPLRKYHVERLEPASSDYIKLLKSDLKSGSPEQYKKIEVIESKIIQYSLAMQEAIQELVEKKNLLMRNSVKPYMDNACCNENEQPTTALQYFNNENDNISKYNVIVRDLTAVLKDINTITQPTTFFYPENTKSIFPSVSNNFEEETIYRAFISYCNFSNYMPIPDDLLVFCRDKPEYINKTETINEQIMKMKRDGRNYTQQDFIKLLQVVSNHNIINIPTMNYIYSNVKAFNDLFESLEGQTQSSAISPNFMVLMNKLTDTYDISNTKDPEEMSNMRNYLVNNNDELRKRTIEFISKYGNLKKAELTNLTNFLNNLTKWNFEKDTNLNKNIADNAMFNSNNFFKNFVENFVKIYPNILLNHDFNFYIPTIQKYAKLSDYHKEDLFDINKNYYSHLTKYLKKESISKILKQIQKEYYIYVLLAKYTPAFSDIATEDKTIYSIFNKEITTLLYEHYILKILYRYTKLSENVNMLVNTTKTFEEEVSEFAEDINLTEEYAGDIRSLQKDVAGLLVSYLKTMKQSKDAINFSNEDVSDMVFKNKEREKEYFISKFENLTDSQREIENILKVMKLGDTWSKGLKKSVREYDPDDYDEERELALDLEQQEERLTKKLGRAPTDQEMDEFRDEEAYENEINEIEGEEDLNELGEDYNDGDYYGEDNDEGDYY